MITRLILGTVLVPIFALLAVWALPVQADEVPALPMTTPCMKNTMYSLWTLVAVEAANKFEEIDESCYVGPRLPAPLEQPAADPQPVDERP